MPEARYYTLTRDDLQKRLWAQKLDNEDPERGFALVNVLSAGAFEMARIPGSINIPQGDERLFEERYGKDKEIIVYCASPDCHASDTVADALVRRGFRRVYDYAGGLSDWHRAGNPVDSSPRVQDAPTLPPL